MKLLFLAPSLSRRLGGIFEIELSQARTLERMGVQVSAAGLMDEDWESASCLWKPVTTRVFPCQGPSAFGFSAGLRDYVVANDSDLLHLHALWMYPSVVASSWGKRKKPYIVTPNGMLEPWALANSAWKKKIAGALYENHMLQGAACLQANTEKELRDIRAYGLRNPVAIIPNGVDLPEMGDRKSEIGDQKKILLFLGRLHPKKGLVNALRAWAEVGDRRSEIGVQQPGFRGREDWRFVIAGWDQGGHEQELKELATELGIRWTDVRDQERGDEFSAFSFRFSEFSLLFTGPVFGEQKDQLLRCASAFILPSFSEGLPMSVLEAWAFRLPVLMTDHCNLPEGFAHHAALRIGTDVPSIAAGLQDLFQSPISDLQSLGINGRDLVERQFTWPQVAKQLREVYVWVLGQGPKPDFVFV